MKFKKALTAALWVFAAKRVEGAAGAGVYETVDGYQCYIHPSSIVFGLKPQPDVVIFTEMVRTTKAYMRYVTPIEASWLTELAPERFRT